jgi:hypothetical protein
MRLPLAAHPRTAYGEDAEAAVRAVFGLTVGVGGLAAAMAAAAGELPLVALPTLALLGLLLFGASIVGAAYAAGGVWLVLLPLAQGEALLVPLTMIVLCLAIALGPDRLLAWVARDATPGRGPARVTGDEGWIEEEDGRLG